MSESDIRSRRTRPSSVASRVVPRACPAHAAEVLVGTGRGWQQKSASCDDNSSPIVVESGHFSRRCRSGTFLAVHALPHTQIERSKVASSICSAHWYIAPDGPAILRVPGANRTWAAPMGWSPNHAIRMFSGMGRVVGKWWCGRLGIGCDASPAEYRWQGRRMQLQT